MSASSARAHVGKKKHVRFARLEDDDDDDNHEQEQNSRFDPRKNAAVRGLKSALKAVTRTGKPACEDREEVSGSGGGPGACGRWMVTLALCASFLGLGMSISVLGPTFADLAGNVNKNISNISYIIVGRSAGYIGGSLIGGALIDCMSPHVLLGVSMLFTASGMCAIPFCKQATLLTVFMSGIGLSMGVLDTGGNVLVLNTWGDHAAPHMQALHFSFAAGAFMSPIIAKLLFGSDGAVDARVGSTNLTPPVAAGQATTAGGLTLVHSHSASFRSLWAYIIIGFFLFFIAVLFFLLYFCSSPPPDKARAAVLKPAVPKHHVALVVLLFFFFFAYVGSEVAYGSFIFTFAKDYSHMPPSQAAGLNSLFWGTFAMSRGLAIFFAACLYPGTLILLSLVGTTVSSLLLSLFSSKKVALWLCTGLYGASMATTFPSGISWVEQYIVVTGHTASAFVVGAALGEMVLPALVGYLLGRFPQQPLLMYLSLLSATCTAILFPVMYKLASAPHGQAGKPCARRDPDDGEHRQALLESGANEEEEDDSGTDQWNDANFEVIEMDDTCCLVNSPSEASKRPDVSAVVCGAPSSLSTGAAGGASSPSDDDDDSSWNKLLLASDQEKED